jgi:hypothetical protein
MGAPAGLLADLQRTFGLTRRRRTIHVGEGLRGGELALRLVGCDATVTACDAIVRAIICSYLEMPTFGVIMGSFLSRATPRPRPPRSRRADCHIPILVSPVGKAA